MDCMEIYEGVKKAVTGDFPFGLNWDDDKVYRLFGICYKDILEQHSTIDNSYYSQNGKGLLRIDYLDHYVILCFRFSDILNNAGFKDLADAVYYSMRIRCSIDLFYTTRIGKCFIPVHALGTVVDSHVKYGDYFKIYDGCHIGPYSIVGKDPAEWKHPQIGNFVTMLCHSKVFGNSVVGDNVIISAGTTIVNEEIPDGCIVSGSSPNLMFQKLRISNKSIVRQGGDEK